MMATYETILQYIASTYHRNIVHKHMMKNILFQYGIQINHTYIYIY